MQAPIKRKTSAYTAAQVHFPNPADRLRVEAAAEAVGMSFSKFTREAALARTEKVEREIAKKTGKCPTCGHCKTPTKRAAA